MKLTALLFVIFVHKTFSSEWGYEGRTGPDNWQGQCSSGKTQSPIDIPLTGNIRMEAAPFMLKNYDKTPKKSNLKNVGSTAKMFWDMDKKGQTPQVSGGDLPGTFEFAQMHFHWGMMNKVGSEHTISKVSYPMELHLVHYNTKYGKDLGRAIAGGKGAQDTLAVLGIMFQVQSKPNRKFEPIIQALANITQQDSKVYTKPFTLQDMLPRNINSFYRYDGSLTTPGCNEIVIWTVFKDPVDISSDQLARFRDLAQRNKRMQNNFRPVQPVYNRKIFDVSTIELNSGNFKSVSFFSIIVTVFLAVIMK